jgi:raffinose/stachyose/melibiose transport system permease protein
MHTRTGSGKWAVIAVFTVPTILIYSLIIAYPVLTSLFNSFREWDGVTASVFTGFSNYRRLFTSPDFLISIRNSLIWGVMIFVYQLGLGTVLALTLSNPRLKLRKLFRTVYFIPVVLSVTVICQLWIAIYHGQYGLLNKLIRALGFTYQQDWLSQTSTAIYGVVFVNAWQGVGYHMALIYAARRMIPPDYYEAALIEGVSAFQKFRMITFPLLYDTYKVLTIMVITFGFKAFEHVFIMTGGGPANATYTMTVLMYNAIFKLNSYGYGSAVATTLVLQCVVLMVILNRVFKREAITY